MIVHETETKVAFAGFRREIDCNQFQKISLFVLSLYKNAIYMMYITNKSFFPNLVEIVIFNKVYFFIKL
jgi:hypothetical protein